MAFNMEFSDSSYIVSVLKETLNETVEKLSLLINFNELVKSRKTAIFRNLHLMISASYEDDFIKI